MSLDDEVPQTVDLALAVGDSQREWEQMVLDGVRKVSTRHELDRPGGHVLKLWMIDPAVVVQRVVMSFGEVRPSYFGPPESARAPR